MQLYKFQGTEIQWLKILGIFKNQSNFLLIQFLEIFYKTESRHIRIVNVCRYAVLIKTAIVTVKLVTWMVNCSPSNFFISSWRGLVLQ